MSRSTAARILREEIKQIKGLSDALMDQSKIDHPANYDGSGQLKSIIHRLRMVRKGIRKTESF